MANIIVVSRTYPIDQRCTHVCSYINTRHSRLWTLIYVVYKYATCPASWTDQQYHSVTYLVYIRYRKLIAYIELCWQSAVTLLYLLSEMITETLYFCVAGAYRKRYWV